MKKTGFFKRLLSTFLSIALLLACASGGGLPADAADTGGVSTYLSDFGFAGKTISILGDSISTFQDYCNGAAADTTNSTIRGNYTYYSDSNVSSYGVRVEDTWWMQTADVLGMRVLVNNSWSGSRVINFGTGTPSAYIDRSQQLHDNTGSNAGEEPDVIAIYMGTNDTKNADDPGDINQVDYAALRSVSSSYTPSTVLEAYALMLYRAIKKYPNAEIYCMTLIPYENITAAQRNVLLEFNDGVRKIAAHYGVYVADLYEESGLTSQKECFNYHMANRLHPGPFGMDAITNCLINAMLENSKYNTSTQRLVPVTYDLNDVFVKGGTIQNALQNKPLTLAFGLRNGFAANVSVTMGGEDITAECFHDGKLSISNVTGPVQITANTEVARKTPEIYRWELTSDHMLSVNDGGAVYNGATLIAGSCSDSVFSKAQYSLEKPVILFHDRPWVIRWDTTGAFSGGMLMLSGTQSGNAEGNTYLYRRPNSGLVALGYSDGSSYHNYGVLLSDHGIDGTVNHTYTLVNRLSEDGSNMVYLYVDNNLLGAMNNYYLGGTSKNTTSDWLNGKDLVFTHMGTSGHPLNGGTINHIQIWEDGAPEEIRRYHYRWEPQNGNFTSLTEGSLTENTLKSLGGSISATGKFTGSSFQPEKPIVLLHDQPWSLEWSSSGSWKDAGSGAMLLAASNTANAPNGAYLYRRNGSDFIALGERANNVHNNYGISLADHGIDGTAQHTYRLTNRIKPDGSNMVYLFVDGVEIGALNNYYVGGSAQGTTSNWISGRDFTFNYLGTTQFPVGNCYLQYLQVWERGIEAKKYGWQPQNDQLVPVAEEGYSVNNLITINGTITDGKISGGRFQLTEPVTLRHDRTWSVEWKSSGTWKETSNGAMLLSSSAGSGTNGTVYLYRRSGSSLIGLGRRSGNKHLNYAIDLSAHGIDGSAEHIYRLTNRIHGDGSNMIYLSVDGIELGAMNNYYVSTTFQNTTDNWLSGQDLVFSYLGTSDFPIGNCNLEYLRICEVEDASADYRWEMQNETLTAVKGQNNATIQSGSVTDGIFANSYFALEKTLVLMHNKPWSVEWQSEGNWSNSAGGSVLFSNTASANVAGNVFVHRKSDSGLLSIGTVQGGKYYNYGLILSDYGIDGTKPHVYRLTNRLQADGSNMVYLYVDGEEIAPMNNYFVGSTAQGTTSDWLSGQNLPLSYIGTGNYALSNCSIGYIQIWEDGIGGQNYRWEAQNDILTDLKTEGFASNEATLLGGSISDGLYHDARYQLQNSVVLRHDEPWVIRWQSEGSWKDSSNGGMLLSSHPERTTGMSYLYRRNGSDFIALGIFNGTYYNYGIRLSDYGIDGTAKHEYTLINRIREDGTNMVYLFVDGEEQGALDREYPGAKETFTKSDWISGKDFSFNYLGNTAFPVGNCALDYLQVWESGVADCVVTFLNEDGTVLSTGNYALGQQITAPANPPSKAADRTASYAFAGWSAEVGACMGDTVFTPTFIATNHSYESVSTAPGCTTDGSVLHTCTNCGYIYVEEQPQTGHSYRPEITEPSCTEAGYTTYTCVDCGVSYVSDEVAALGHSFVNGACTLCGEADPDYVKPLVIPTLTLKAPTLEFKDMIKVIAFYTAENLDDVVEMGMITFKTKVETIDILTADHVIPSAEYDEGSGRYFASSQGIHAKYLGDTVYLACYAKLTDGSYVYTKLASYSPLDYAINQLQKSTDGKLKQLCAAMLNYGAAAQNYFLYNTDCLANSTLTDEQLALPEIYREDMVATVANASAQKQGSFANNQGFSSRKPAVSFEGAFSINYFFTPKYVPVGEITLYYWTEEDFESAEVLTAENATGSIIMDGEGVGQYRGDIEGIAAKNLTNGVYVAGVYSDGTNTWTSGVLGYSIGAYCASQATKGGAMAELAMATAVYGYHAKTYFG